MPKKPKQRRRADEPLVQKIFNRRGTVEILVLLSDSSGLRFSEIDQNLTSIAPQVLSARLAELREIGMVVRTVSEGPPLATSYELSDLGVELAVIARGLKSIATSSRLPALAV
jgi:DNA-binding HxlR family transcriptional regulator